MNINDFFSTVQSYEELYHVAEKATPHHSFFGSRFITVQGYQGQLPLDAIMERVLQLEKKNIEFNETERKYGQFIVKKIDWIYEKSDEQVRASNIFSQLFVYLNDIFFYILPKNRHISWVREDWKMGFTDLFFEYYTRRQFLKAFWITPEVARQSGWDLGFKVSSSKPDRWSVNKAEKVSFFDLLKSVTFLVISHTDDEDSWLHGKIEWSNGFNWRVESNCQL
ncbi:MAG: hypothetical protein K1000chlam3_01015 [Chlamydiae bacterium]|nr:hypothetical protein [Chlamydiota bacterium]